MSETDILLLLTIAAGYLTYGLSLAYLLTHIE